MSAVRFPTCRGELLAYQAHGLLVLGDAGAPSEADLPRIRRIRRLRRDLGLSYDTIEIVLRLVERVERLEADRRPAERPRVRITVVGR